MNRVAICRLESTCCLTQHRRLIRKILHASRDLADCSIRTGDGQRERLDNPAVAGSHPIPSACFDGSETKIPSGYTKGRCLRVSAFSRSIASSGNDFEQRHPVSLSHSRFRARHHFTGATPPLQAKFVPNSRLSLCLAPSGLSGVASGSFSRSSKRRRS